MITSIERSSPYIHLSKAQIQDCIKSLATNSKVKSYILASSGLANTNYIVTLNDSRKIVLRVYSSINFVKGLKELKLSKLLINFSVVPKIYYFHPTKSNNFSYSLVDFVKGSILSEVHSSNTPNILTSVYFELGLMLSQLKEIKFTTTGLLDENLKVVKIDTKNNKFHPVVNFIMDCLENANFIKRTGIKLKNAIYKLLVDQEFILYTIDEENHLVHGDLKVENIIVNYANQKLHLAGVIDWEHARSDTSYGDIATLFRGDYDKNSLLKHAFAKGYESNRTALIQDWDKAGKLIDLLNLCSFLCSDKDRTKLYEVIINHLNLTILYFK